MYRMGLLSCFKKFNTHYLARRLIRKDDHIIDIGANFGYYTSIFADKSGNSGKVFAVEPVREYQEILKSNTKKYSNIEIIPYALSDNEGESYMGIPSNQKFRHGLTRISEDGNNYEDDSTYKVLTKTPESIFGSIDRLDYIKCDIEGHEAKVMPGFKKLIEKFHPLIQIEIERLNFELINNLLSDLGYNSFIVSGNKLIPLDPEKEVSCDIIFVPEKRKNQLIEIIKQH